MIIHTVLFRFADPADAAEARRRLETLPGQVPALDSLWTGLDVVREPGSYDLALVTTHADRQALRAYVDHPAHQAVAAFLRARATARAAVDADVETAPPTPGGPDG